MGYYLVNIGPNEKNVGGVGARGYWIRRNGRVVRRSWGPVDVEGGGGGTFYWRGQPQGSVDRFSSADEAAEFVDKKLREKLVHASGGYRRLPSPTRIY
jgi:hypothetical protein